MSKPSRLLPASWLLLLVLLAPQAALAGFVDDSGQSVSTDKPYTRVISLYGAHTENLLALGLGGELIGINQGDEALPGAAGKPVFSYHDDPERFLAARPDLVLVRPMIWRGYRQLLERLQKHGIAVVSLQPNTTGELYEYWRGLGALTSRVPQAEKMIADFAAQVEAVQARVAHIPPDQRVKVYLEAIHGKMKTVAPDSMAAFCLAVAGGVNLAAEAESVRGTNIAAFGKERILALAPVMDVYLAQVGPMNKVSLETITSESGFAALKAVATGRVHLIDEALISRPTPRLVEGMAAIQALLYPGLAGEAGK